MSAIGNLFGGAPSPPRIDLGQQLGKVFNVFQRQELPTYEKWIGSQPNLVAANQIAQAGVPQAQALAAPLQTGYENWISPIIQSGGALSPQQVRAVSQGTLSQFAGRDNVFGQAEANQILNLDQARQQRFLTMMGAGMGAATGLQGLQQTPFANLLTAQQAGTSGFANLLGVPAQFGMDVTGFNANAQAAQQIANANKAAGTTGSLLSSLGRVGAAAASNI